MREVLLAEIGGLEALWSQLHEAQTIAVKMRRSAVNRKIDDLKKEVFEDITLCKRQLTLDYPEEKQ